MLGVDLVVGHGGYHLVHETRSLDVPMAVLSLEKSFDDQDARVATYSSDKLIPFRSPTELENIFRRFLSAPLVKRKKVQYKNGAEETARIILDFRGAS
jgi:hypothetical protein